MQTIRTCHICLRALTFDTRKITYIYIYIYIYTSAFRISSETDFAGSVYAGEPGLAAGDGFAAANAVALRARVRELEVETGLMQRELDHVGELAERQSQQLQCALCPKPFLEVLHDK